jgi:hypothetical protein
MSKYKLTRSEFSQKLGIPTDTLKKRMRRGQYKDDYIFENGKYLFSGDARVGPKQVINKPMSLGTKRVRNRGNHFNSKNPNYKPQFQRTNEIRMLAKLKHNVDEETQEVLPEAIAIAKQQKQERIRKALEQPIKKPYSYTSGLINLSTNHRDHSNPIIHKTRPNLVVDTNRGKDEDKREGAFGKYYW